MLMILTEVRVRVIVGVRIRLPDFYIYVVVARVNIREIKRQGGNPTIYHSNGKHAENLLCYQCNKISIFFSQLTVAVLPFQREN